MITKKLRRGFLKYFKSKSHTIVPSSSVVPHDDPTILFTNAGMNQFKDVFLGTSKRDYKRATSSQKCIRVGGKHNDLENVGHTSRHLTFFEMLGNFSFGDYFKKEAIDFAWDVTCNTFNFDPDKIWASVFKDDDEAFALWERYLPSSRIVRFDEKENFWAMGDTGPCGPCTELLYDRGESYSDALSPIDDPSGERYLEFWNLVFMEFNKDESGEMKNLPKPCVDTGTGLERLSSIKMGVDSVFATDIFQVIIKGIEKISKIKYDPENRKLAPAFHVIADHLRALFFAISDGAQPSNMDRGYVLRKILRRACKYGRMLNLKEPFLAKLTPYLIEAMGDDYPQLTSSKKRVSEILTMEEENFIRTLKRGGNLLNDIIERSRDKISGDDAFKLKDTYGFPIEEILLLAKDAMLDVDLKKFYKLEENARERSRQAKKSTRQTFSENLFTDFAKIHKKTEFVGYDNKKSDSLLIAILKGERFTDSVKEGEDALLIIDRTPFYAEMGGQVGDRGSIYLGENIFEVEDTISPFPGVIAHLGSVKSGTFKKGEKVHAEIDADRRKRIENNHSATHILHFALLKVLGDHITQSGSYVDEKRIRFDFSHQKALTYDEVKEIEKLVNEKIRENIETKIYMRSLEDVQKDKSIKQIFGEKYEKEVRVVDFTISKELCGGCHTKRLGDIGLFKILKEMSIAAGIRRIEAATGLEAENFVYEKQEFISYLETVLKTDKDKMIDRIENLILENKRQSTKLKGFRKKELADIKKELLKKLEMINKVPLIAEEIKLYPDELASFANDLSAKLKSSVIALGIEVDNRCQILIRVSPDIIERGIFANLLAEKIAPIISGGAGGRENFAQAGGARKEKIKEALNELRSIIRKC